MADQTTIDKFKKWWHEKKRANYFAHPNYATDCQEEMDSMLIVNPELSGEVCGCSQCLANVYTG